MTDYMGQGPMELPLGTPPPMITPPEGVVISRIEADGWTRKYLYQSRRGMGDKILENSLLIAEIPPTPRPIRHEVPLEITPAVVLPQEQAPQAATPPLAMTPQLGQMPVPGSAGAMRVPGRGVSSPFSGAKGAEAVLPPRPQLAGTNLPVLSSAPPPRSLRLAQGPQSPAPVSGANCPPPGPMQLPDGRVIQLDSQITLADLWQILPYMTQQCVAQAKEQAAPPGPAGAMPTSPIGAGFPGFGPATGMFGTGGFGSPGGGALPGPLGVVNQNTPQPSSGGGGSPGPAGPPGPPGPAGVGAAIDFVTKTDGDFTAGPGSFVPVPGTLLAFTQGTTGSAIFIINACFGCGFPNAQNDALGIEVDGTIFPLQANLWHTFVAGVGSFLQGASASWPMVLGAGSHTVQIMLRGITAGEFCSAAGLGTPATVSANPDVPLTLSVLHQGVGAPAPGTAVLVVDGISKTDTNFTATGALTAVPGTSVAFNVSTPGNVQVIVSADFVGNPFASIPANFLGVIIDGGPAQLLATMSEIIGAGGDRVFTCHLTGMIVIPLSVGPHAVQMAYFSGPGGPAPMSLVASTALPATVSVIHP